MMSFHNESVVVSFLLYSLAQSEGVSAQWTITVLRGIIGEFHLGIDHLSLRMCERDVRIGDQKRAIVICGFLDDNDKEGEN